MESALTTATSIDAPLGDRVVAYVSHAKTLASDGLSVADFAELATSLLRLCVAALDSIPAEGPQKRAWAVAAVGSLFDAVADRCVPIYAVPVWFVLRPAIRATVLLAAAGVVESILPIVRASK